MASPTVSAGLERARCGKMDPQQQDIFQVAMQQAGKLQTKIVREQDIQTALP